MLYASGPVVDTPKASVNVPALARTVSVCTSFTVPLPGVAVATPRPVPPSASVDCVAEAIASCVIDVITAEPFVIETVKFAEEARLPFVSAPVSKLASGVMSPTFVLWSVPPLKVIV